MPSACAAMDAAAGGPWVYCREQFNCVQYKCGAGRVFSGAALDSRLPRMASVVAPHSTPAVTPSASPSHCRSPAAGRVKPSAKPQATPAKAISSPAICAGLSFSDFAMNGMPSATTKGEM